MDVPEVPAFCPPPPPAAASRTIEVCAAAETRRTIDSATAEVQRSIEALGETLCHRIEHVLERTLERTLEAAVTRTLGTGRFECLQRICESVGTKDSPFSDGKAGDCQSKSDQQEHSTDVPLPAPQASPPLSLGSSSSGVGERARKQCSQDGCAAALPSDGNHLLAGLELRFDDDGSASSSVQKGSSLGSGSGGNCHRGLSSPTIRNAATWPSWVGKADAPENDLFKHHDGDVQDTRLKVDIRVNFKEIEARGLDTRGKLLDRDSRILRMTNMPSMVFDTVRFPCMQRFVLHPTSNPILVWHIIGPILLCYDIVIIPLQAFPLPELIVFSVISLITTSYWTLDMVRGFFTGYETDRAVEMRPGPIATRYVKSWFGLDALTCIVDWTFILLGNIGMFNKFWRTGRAIHAWRLLRLVRLVRVLKFTKKVTSFAADQVTSIQGLITLKSTYVGFGVVFASHYMACYWYLVADLSYPIWSKTNWLSEQGLANASLLEVYFCAFHWAISQSGFTSSRVYPTNTLERLYASWAGFCWLIVVAVTINLFSIWLRHLHEANRDREKQNINLRRYLEEHDISRKLTSRVLRCFRANYHAHQSRIHEDQIDFLQDLPVTLKICLRREVFMPVLNKHPFFSFLALVNPTLPIMITYCAMEERRHLAGEVVFHENTPATHMLYVLIGRLDYYAVQNGMKMTKLRAGDWALEPALWLRWTCRGRLMTEIVSELVSVDVEKFMAIMYHVRAKGEDIESIKMFARNVCEHFYSSYPSTDLWGDPLEVQEIGEDILASRTPPYRFDQSVEVKSWSVLRPPP